MSARADLAAGLAPDRLVAGDDAGLLLLTIELESWSASCQESVDGFCGMSPVWQGRARERWDRRTETEVRRWRVAESAFRGAADALQGYRRALAGARASAHQARTLWDTGVAERAAQEEQVRTQKAQARASGERVFIEPYITAGDATKDRAALLLDQARTAVADAGRDAAATLARLAELAPHRKPWMQTLVEYANPALNVIDHWGTLTDSDTWESIGWDVRGFVDRDPDVMREVGAGFVIGVGDAFTAILPRDGAWLNQEWKSATNQWSWEHGMATGGTAMAGAAFVGSELVNNASGPEGRAASITERSAARLLKRMDRYIERYGITDLAQTWDKASPFHRGFIYEATQGGNLPGGFKTIDIWDSTSGTATSLKSMDLRAPSYASDARVESTLRGYVDSMTDYRGGRSGEFVINRLDIEHRSLVVAVPPDSLHAGHREIVDRLQRYASDNGVSLVVKEWP